MRAPKSQYPLLGFNSYDCWNSDMDEAKCLANIEAFVKRLKPFGYEYFCIDAGWYLDEYFCERAKMSSADLHAIVDDFGRPQASKRKFPHGIKFISDTCHKNGIKFGIHQMRGIPVEALTKETTIKGTGYKVADIVDKDNVCSWSTRYYGVDMTKPGAQEYYDSIVEYFDENGVDFIKLDDVAEQPDEIEAFSKAIEKASRPIVLSLSPGNFVNLHLVPVYSKYADMVRITGDIWDRPSDLEAAFERWEHWQESGDKNFWLDLDMVPFGILQCDAPPAQPGRKPAGPGPLLPPAKHPSDLTLLEKRTFITQRALSASPIFFGGELTLSPDEDISLVTNPTVLACNRNGICAKRVVGERLIDIRVAPSKDNPNHGWFGVFNRRPERPHRYSISIEMLKLPPTVDLTNICDVWTQKPLIVKDGKLHFDLQPSECRFYQY